MKDVNNLLYVVDEIGQIQAIFLQDSMDLTPYLLSKVLAETTDNEVYIRYPILSDSAKEICKKLNIRYGNSDFVPFKYLGE